MSCLESPLPSGKVRTTGSSLVRRAAESTGSKHNARFEPQAISPVLSRPSCFDAQHSYPDVCAGLVRLVPGGQGARYIGEQGAWYIGAASKLFQCPFTAASDAHRYSYATF